MEIDPARQAAVRDLLDHLKARGHGPLLDALSDENVVTRDHGRVNVSALSRRLGTGHTEAKAQLDRLREAIREQTGHPN